VAVLTGTKASKEGGGGGGQTIQNRNTKHRKVSSGDCKETTQKIAPGFRRGARRTKVGEKFFRGKTH